MGSEKYCRECGRDLERSRRYAIDRIETVAESNGGKPSERPQRRYTCHFCEKQLRQLRKIHGDGFRPGLLARYADERWELAKKCTCPNCWNVFAPEDVHWVSQHRELLGDKILGPDAQIRDLPTIYNEVGNAIDTKGMVSSSMACPKCHLVIARPVLDMEPIFMSIVGAPGAGKTFLLTSMIWNLRQQFPEHFSLLFRDADPASNRVLIDNEQTLFGSADRESVKTLEPTQDKGIGYNIVNFGEQMHHLLRPLLFVVQPKSTHPRRDDPQCVSRLICLYDNSGEDFIPSHETNRPPSTEHLSKARVLFFVYDPTQESRFAQQLGDANQLSRSQGFRPRQETILNETAKRIRGLTRQGTHEKIACPLIVIVPKLDLWKHLLPDCDFDTYPDPIITPEGSNVPGVDINRIETVSKKVASLLRKTAPDFVAYAEEFSTSSVTFIPTSATGCEEEIDMDTNKIGLKRKFGFRPKNLKPLWATAPMLYAFSWYKPLLEVYK